MEDCVSELWGFRNYAERNELGQTVLHIAILKELSMVTIKKILKFGSAADVNAKDKVGNTPLHLALFPPPGNTELVKLLLHNGASVNEKNIHGQTALHSAMKYMNLQIIDELLENGADVNAKDTFGMTPFLIAIENSTINVDIFKKILSAGVSLCEKNNSGYMALHVAMLNQTNLEIIQLLICEGNVNAQDNSGMTPLHIACSSLCKVSYYERFDLIKYLISYGASVLEKNVQLQTPLHVAIENDMPCKIVEVLLSNGAKVNIKDTYFVTPLFLALHSSSNSIETTKILLKYGASVYQKVKGETPLHTAVRKGKTFEILEELLKHGSDVNAKDSCNVYSVPPLYRALINSPIDYKTVKLLLKYGASVHERETLGQITLRDSGENKLTTNVVKELLKYALTEHSDSIHCILCNSLCSNCSKYICYISELNKMKNKYIVDKLTLYDFIVHKFDYGKMYSKDHDVLSNYYFFRYVHSEYPTYHNIILNTLRTKEYLLTKLCDLFISAENNQHTVVYLNSDCLREIGKYLSKNDMINFLHASNL